MEKHPKAKQFREELLKWHSNNPRPLPWKSTRDPYNIWVSEIILQQTRVAQGIKYYNRFLKHYPTIHHLANSTIDDLLKVWEGLGYYSRARNMYKTAKTIVNKHCGEFPTDIEELQKLNGIGEYTAAAISSFAFGKAHPVIDGNVIRVISRIFNIQTEVQKAETKKEIKKWAHACLDREKPDIYNQAIMNFGAIQCIPRKPDCKRCSLSYLCLAYKKGTANNIPAKKVKPEKKKRYFNYLVIHSNNNFVIRQRTQKDIWEMLYDFPIIEEEHLGEHEWTGWVDEFTNLKSKPRLVEPLEFSQVLSHQKIHARFYKIETEHIHLKNDSDEQYLLVNRKNLRNFTFPKIIDCYLKENSIYLKK